MKSLLTILSIVVLSVCQTTPGWANIRHVPAEFSTIQAGIDAADNGDTVLLSAGLYTGEGNRDLSFGGKIIHLLGDAGAEQTIIDVQGSTGEHHRGFHLKDAETNDAIIEGITIKNGAISEGAGILLERASPTLRGIIFKGNDALIGSGGGIQAKGNSAPIITDCKFINNTANIGCGGGLSVSESSAKISKCDFQNNTAFAGGGINLVNATEVRISETKLAGNSAAGGGGGMFAEVSDCFLIHTEFSDNIAPAGGGILTNTTQFVVCDVDFYKNTATAGSGGGLKATLGSTFAALRTVFVSNHADIGCGGGMSSDESGGRIEDCIFIDNTASAGGGFNFVEDSSSTMTKCTFIGNSATGDGGGIYCDYSTPTITYTLVTNGVKGPAVGCLQAQPVIHCSNLYGNAGGDWVGDIAGQYTGNNLSIDPNICSADPENYSLEAQSVCLAANNDCGQVIGALARGVCLPTDVYDETVGLPGQYSLTQNFPNPFNPVTKIRFTLPLATHATLTVYNSLGQHVSTLLNGRLSAGLHEVTWDGSSQSGDLVASGIYFYKLVTPAATLGKKMVLLK